MVALTSLENRLKEHKNSDGDRKLIEFLCTRLNQLVYLDY